MHMCANTLLCGGLSIHVPCTRIQWPAWERICAWRNLWLTCKGKSLPWKNAGLTHLAGPCVHRNSHCQLGNCWQIRSKSPHMKQRLRGDCRLLSLSYGRPSLPPPVSNLLWAFPAVDRRPWGLLYTPVFMQLTDSFCTWMKNAFDFEDPRLFCVTLNRCARIILYLKGILSWVIKISPSGKSHFAHLKGNRPPLLMVLISLNLD